MPSDPQAGAPDRRAFLRSAVAIGGAQALAACLDRERGGSDGGGRSDRETGGGAGSTDDDVGRSDDEEGTTPAEGGDDDLPERQHAWNDHLLRDAAGDVVPPRHQVLLFLDHTGGSEDAAEEVERAFRTLERAFAWSNDGLLFTVGYSPGYFADVGATLPDAVDLPEPRALSSLESPTLDDYDVAIHLASDHASAVLGAEEALTGGVEAVNGEPVEARLTPHLEKRDRRTGFVGAGLPAEHQDVDGIPEDGPVHDDAPLYMGFKSTHDTNQATEDAVTVSGGELADATTQHVSQIRLDLEDWYGMDGESRVDRMFTAATDLEDVGVTGERGRTSPHPSQVPVDPEGHAKEHGVVGHGEKAARGRTDEDNAPPLLRRDVDSDDGGHAGVHFVSLQRRIADFERVRVAMTGADIAADAPDVGPRRNNGILDFIEVERRANYLVPPRRIRALPYL